MSYSKKKRQLQGEKEARLNKTPEKEARIKCKEKENVCVEEARRESIKENEKKAVDMSQEVSTRSMAVLKTTKKGKTQDQVRTTLA